MDFRKQVLTYARKIALYRYPAEILINGLQPLEDWRDPRDGEMKPGLISKYQRKLEEFREAKAIWITSGDKADLYGEAADRCYYAIQIDEQQDKLQTLIDTFVDLAGPTSQISQEEARAITLAKYARRSASKDSKDLPAEALAIEGALAEVKSHALRRGGTSVLSARGMPDEIKNELIRQANEAGLSLEAYNRRILMNAALAGQVVPSKLSEMLHSIIDEMKM